MSSLEIIAETISLNRDSVLGENQAKTLLKSQEWNQKKISKQSILLYRQQMTIFQTNWSEWDWGFTRVQQKSQWSLKLNIKIVRLLVINSGHHFSLLTSELVFRINLVNFCLIKYCCFPVGYFEAVYAFFYFPKIVFTFFFF